MPVDVSVPIIEFGDRLIETRDLDPLYVGLVGARLPREQLHRWLLCYWCFYHVGVASYTSQFEGQLYWDWVRFAAENKTETPVGSRWPRAAERRHFRGHKCVDAVHWLADHYPNPDTAVPSLYEGYSDLSERGVMWRAQQWPLFGPWISFKVADMLERVAGVPVKFSADSILMYEEPRKALDLLAAGGSKSPEDWYRGLLQYYSARRAPPLGDRVCGPQEVETVLCKYKSMKGGHYHVGKDIHEQREALHGWGATAERLLKAYPAEVA